MESFIGAIVEDWHMFMDDTKRFDLFRNIFIIYNSTLDKSFDELKEKYGIESLLTNVHLHNDLENATTKKNVIYLHKHNFSKEKIKSIIHQIDTENDNYTYEEAIAFLERFVHNHNQVNEQTVALNTD